MSDSGLVKLMGSCRSGRAKDNRRRPIKQPVKSYVPEVTKKLRRHPDYQDRRFSENQLKLEAEDLTDADKIMERYFSTITHDPLHERMKEHEISMHSQFSDSYERRRQRRMGRIEDVAKFQVKLVLRYVNQDTRPPRFIGKIASALQMEYGPLHASLLINNEILLEWNASNLVIPKRVDPYNGAQSTPILVSATVPDHMQIQRHLSKPFEEYDEVELLIDAVSQKIDLLQNLARVIALYNSLYYYDIIFKNCQNFVLDALNAIGCQNKPQFGGNLRDYFTHLKREGRVMAGFETHQQLNAYVMENHASLSHETMEYLLAQYFLFHMQGAMRSGNVEDWHCRDGECMMDYLEAKVDEKLLIMHRYLHTADNHALTISGQ